MIWLIVKSLALLGITVSFGWVSLDLYYFDFPVWALALAGIPAIGFIVYDLWVDVTRSRLTC